MRTDPFAVYQRKPGGNDMIKLVIADDEPLALIGLQSMIDW